MSSNLVINLLLSFSLNHIWSLVHCQQIIVMMPLFDVNLPANAGYFFRFVLQIASFDIIDVDYYFRAIFGVPGTEPVSLNFEMVGFEGTYFISNMGTLFITYLLGALLLGFLWLMKKLERF